MFNGKGFTNTKYVEGIGAIDPATDGRGWNNMKGIIAVRPESKTNLFHEAMHTVEAQRPWIGKAMKKWASSKAYGMPISTPTKNISKIKQELWDHFYVGRRMEKPVFKLAGITGMDYRDSEIAWVDQYQKEYMGKFYETKKGPLGQDLEITEVLTIAAESFADHRTMYTLWRNHPELFKFLVFLTQTR